VSAAERDPALRRFERDAVLACLGLAACGLAAVWPTRGIVPALNGAAGVLGGGLLMALSYRAIKGAASLVVETMGNEAGGPLPPENRGSAAGDHAAEQDVGPARLPAGRRAFLAVKFFTRYALLAVAAYVMLTCFRLHPVGLVVGATSPFLAAVMQVGRLSRRGARRRHS
jgi:hypothetical protein